MTNISVLMMMFVLAARTLGGQSALELAGNWHGNGTITSTWCDQDTLHFDFNVSPDDEISGRIGDAVILSGTTEMAPAPAECSFIIRVKLKGSLIECEDVKRTTLVMLVNCDGDTMTGSFYTEGSVFGRKDDGSLTGTSLRLYYK